MLSRDIQEETLRNNHVQTSARYIYTVLKLSRREVRSFQWRGKKVLERVPRGRHAGQKQGELFRPSLR